MSRELQASSITSRRFFAPRLFLFQFWVKTRVGAVLRSAGKIESGEPISLKKLVAAAGVAGQE
jgi:hypothetical protein